MKNPNRIVVIVATIALVLSVGVILALRSLNFSDGLWSALENLFIEDASKYPPDYWLTLSRSIDLADRRRAIRALIEICDDTAIVELVRMSGDADAYAGYEAHDGLNCVGPQHRDASGAISQFLEDSDINRRLAALFALRRIGRSASEFGPELMQAFDRSTEPDEKAEILLSLAHVRGVDAIPVLEAALEDKSEPIKDAARRGLAVVRRETPKSQ